MKNLVLWISLLITYWLPAPLGAQPDYHAENFTITDLDGQQHILYDYLDAGKSVLLVFLAPWCQPCIELHNSGILQEVYATRGPGSASDDVVIFYIDTDPGTEDFALEGNPDFTAVDFPVCNLSEEEFTQFEDYYSEFLSGWPYYLGICPERSMRTIGIEGVAQTISWLAAPKVDAGPDFEATCYQPNIAATVTDVDSFYVTFHWVERLPNGSATNPPFPNTELNPEINETGIFMLSASNILNGCGGADEVVVTGIDKEAPLLFADQDSLVASCFGDTIEVFTSGLYGAGVWDRSWTTEDGQIIEILDSTSHHILVQGGGTYTTTTFDNLNGCTSTLEIVVSVPPALSLDSIYVLDVFGNPVNGAISIFVSGGTGPFDVLWNNGASGMSISDLSPGDYTCTITDANGCELVSGPIEVLLSTGDVNIQKENSLIQLYPNPADNLFTITIPDLMAEGTIELFDLHGQLLESWNFSAKGGESLSFSVGHFVNGMFIGRVRNRDRFYGHFRLLKE